MFRLNINNSFVLMFPTIIICMIFTYADIKAQSINISLANAYSNHPLLFSERILINAVAQLPLPITPNFNLVSFIGIIYYYLYIP